MLARLNSYLLTICDAQEVAVEPVMSFGYWARRQRKALDLTQAELAQCVGCAAGTIRHIEADERRPSRHMAERLAECLRIPADERSAFISAARAELSPDRLALPPQPVHHTDALTASPKLSEQPPQPSGTVTFLFTDIEGSSKLWEQHKEAMRAALARHNALLHQSIEANRGSVFKTIGDAVCAAFASAPDALAAALTAQRALLAEDWGTVGVLRVRMALHTGTVQPFEGDYLGRPLNRVARLLSVGHGSQVLLSRATQELVRDDLPQDVALRDLGEHRLKDLTRPEHIFQLVSLDLPANFPPLVTLDQRSTNLPIQPTPLIGREQEVNAVRVLLQRSDVRLLTLIGPGGTGKTRLGLQVAAELLDDFVDGVWFINLAPLGDPTLVAGAIAQTLDINEGSGQPLVEGLKASLRAKRVLLLLDNFEQIVAAAPLVGELLTAVPGLKVLVTSRIPLHLYGEREHAVPPLALPDRRHLPPIERLTMYDAVRLFIERAEAAKADFTVTNENAPAVAEICYQLDGLPLAIELAAARVKLFPPQALLARLGNRLRMLTGGPYDRPARQQTLRNAIDWSYDLLDEGEKKLFARLGVFVGGATLETIDAVCNADGDLLLDSTDGVAALIDKSLLQQAEGLHGEPRITMLETIHEYALERLAELGEEDAIRWRHAEYYLALGEAAESYLYGSEQDTYLARLEMEHDNLRAVLEWSQTFGALELGVRLAGALWHFWELHGHFTEGRRWLQKVLETSSTLGAERAKVLTGVGTIAWCQGDYAQAALFHEQALALYQALEDRRGIAFSLNNLGMQAFAQEDTARAMALIEESLMLYRQLEDKQGISLGLSNLGEAARGQGDYARAAVLYQESLALRQEQGDKGNIAASLHNLGIVAREQGDYQQAEALFKESLILFRVVGYRWGIVAGLAEWAELANAKGQVKRAVRLFGATDSLYEVIGAHAEPAARVRYERAMAAARIQLGETAFAAPWAEGRAMTLEQAIAYALETDQGTEVLRKEQTGKIT